MPESLSQFVEHARGKGMDHASIFLLLRAAGWKEREIADALAARELAMPLPERVGLGSARDAFLHLLVFTALYAWVISLIVLLFTYVEFAFPDPVERTSTWQIEAALSRLRLSLATILVAYPLFLVVWWYMLAEVRHFPERAQGAVRRWLTFLSLFVAAVTIMTDVIVVVYYLVEGDLTIRFLLKVSVLFVVTAGLFAYLALTMRGEAEAAK